MVFTPGIVRFDPVLAIEKYIPEIQEDLRKNGFPKLRERIAHRHLVRLGEQEGLELRIVKQWEFSNSANQTSVLVDQESVGVETTHYSTYKNFDELLRLALQIGTDRLEVGDILRCGLRYVDAVDQPPEGGFGAWIREDLLGFKNLDGFEQAHSHSVTQLQSGQGTTLLVKATLTPQGIVLPPDLLPCDLAFRTHPVRNQPFVLMDFDHYSESPFPYDRVAALTHLATLHDGLDRAFRAAVTPYAIEQWKKA